MDKLKELFKSRKFWALIVAVVVNFFGERGGVDPTTLTNATYALVAYILGTALAESKAK